MRSSAYKFDKRAIRYYRHVKKLTGFIKRHLFLIVTTLAVWTFFANQMPLWNGYYESADGYMRALRVYHWLLAPSFAEHPIYESNYPFGEILHWTRPMDIIWILMTIPFRYLHELKDTIFISGAFIAPCLGVITTVTLAYGLRRTFNLYLVLIGCILFLANPLILSYFKSSVPDHHALMSLLSVYCFSLTLCWLKKRQNRYLRWLGLTLALAVFTAIEGIILYTIFIGFFLYLYIFKNISLNHTVKITKYFATGLTVFWFLNPPYEGWLYPDNGRLSILYVTAAWLAFVIFWGLEKSRLHTPKLKILSLWSMGLGFSLALALLFTPKIFQFPITPDARLLFKRGCLEFISFPNASLETALALWLYPLLSILLSLYMIEKKAYHRLMTLNLYLGLPIFVLSLTAARFTNYVSLYTILPTLAWLDYLYKKSSYAKTKSGRFPEYIWTAVLCILILPSLCAAPYYISQQKQETQPQITPMLCQKIKNTGGTLLTDMFLSPQYVWSCDVNTVATPYHRNIEGIRETLKMLNTQTVGEAIPFILKHQITQILLFDNYNSSFYPLTEKNKNKLYYRLIKRQNVPPYLEEIPTTPASARLYKIKI